MPDDLTLREGDAADYAALAEHHYRAQRPVTMTRVLVLEHEASSVCGRFLGRRGEVQRVGVLVESLPALACVLRDWALGDRYARVRDRSLRASLLNREVRCISRVVVHPQWRGRGVAVRLVREALATARTRVTEALAAMGHVNPFFERAGMAAHTRPPHERDARLAAALRCVGVAVEELAAADAAWRKILALPQTQREWIESELSRWCGKPQAGEDALRAARGRLLCEPVYYVKLREE